MKSPPATHMGLGEIPVTLQTKDVRVFLELRILQRESDTDVRHSAARIALHTTPRTMRRGLAAALFVAYYCWYCSTICLAAPWVGVLSVSRNDGAQDLWRTHSSLRNQTIPVHWTLADCGSEDARTLASIASIRKDPLVRVMRLRARTPLECLSRALQQELPKYVSVLGVGDAYTPPALETMAWSLFSNDQPIVSSCYTQSVLSQGAHHPVCSMQPPCACIPLGSLVPAETLRRLCLPESPATGTIHQWWSSCAKTLSQQIGTGYTVPRRMLLTRRFRDWSVGASYFRVARRLTPPQEVYPIVDVPWELPPVEPRAGTGNVILVALPWLYVGGSEFVVSSMIQRLAAAGWTVVVVCTIHDGPLSTAFLPQIHQFTQDVHFLSMSLPVRDHARFFLHVIRTRRVSVVLGSNSMLFYHIAAHLRARAPRVAFVDLLHSVVEDWMHGGYPRMSIDHHQAFDYTLAISRGTLDWMQARQPAIKVRSGVMYPGVDIPAVVPPFASRIGVVSVARMDALKRPSVVIRAYLAAVARLGDEQPPPSLQMVGEGTTFSDAVSICEDAGVVAESPTDPGKVFFHGSLGSSEVDAVLGKTRLYVLASVVEGMPLAASEAMAHGLALIISNVGEVRELVGDAAFRVINLTHDEARDTALFADAILAFLTLSEEEQQAWGERGRERMRRMYNRTKTVGMVLPLLNNLVEEKHKFENMTGLVGTQGDLGRVLTEYVNVGSLLATTLVLQEQETDCLKGSPGMSFIPFDYASQQRVVRAYSGISIVAVLLVAWVFRNHYACCSARAKKVAVAGGKGARKRVV